MFHLFNITSYQYTLRKSYLNGQLCTLKFHTKSQSNLNYIYAMISWKITLEKFQKWSFSVLAEEQR